MGTVDYVRGFEKGQSMMGLKRKEDPNPNRRGKAKNVRQKKTKRKKK